MLLLYTILMVYAFGAYNGSTLVRREKQIESQKQIQFFIK